MVVGQLLERLGHEPMEVTLGEAVLADDLTAEERVRLATELESLGFELIDDPRDRLVQQVKTAVIELVHRDDGDMKVNLSDYLSSRLHMDYNYLSARFSEAEGTTVEKYFIAQKIERVKELLEYGEMSLGEIAEMLHYSSVAHLSAQFKRVTGVTPSEFRRGGMSRRPLDKV